MSERKRYWSAHLDRIATEAITTKAYAEREGLSAAALYYWRSRLKAESAQLHRQSAQPTPARALVPVQVTPSPERSGCTLTLGPVVRLELTELPSPEWLVRLVAAHGAA